mgnify:CR=1 FL=1
MIQCKCGGKFRVSSRYGATGDGGLFRRDYKGKQWGVPLAASGRGVEEFRDRRQKVTELEIKLYAVRKELKNCYENCFGAVGNHADTGA